MNDARYELTSAADGVHFDLDCDDTAELTAWTAVGSDEAFLVLDRNQNGLIDNGLELFGDKSPQFRSDEPNGWRALAIWDDSLNGGNENGKIESGEDPGGRGLRDDSCPARHSPRCLMYTVIIEQPAIAEAEEAYLYIR